MPLGLFLKTVTGKRIAIGGNRHLDARTTKLVVKTTEELIRRGYSIVTGGAEGADHAVMRACMKHPGMKGRPKVFLPGTMDGQYRHYRRIEGARKAKALLKTLDGMRKAWPDAVEEGSRAFRNYREAADYRNGLIVAHSDGFIVFRPHRSRGTADALARIGRRKAPCLVFE